MNNYVMFSAKMLIWALSSPALLQKLHQKSWSVQWLFDFLENIEIWKKAAAGRGGRAPEKIQNRPDFSVFSLYYRLMNVWYLILGYISIHFDGFEYPVQTENSGFLSVCSSIILKWVSDGVRWLSKWNTDKLVQTLKKHMNTTFGFLSDVSVLNRTFLCLECNIFSIEFLSKTHLGVTGIISTHKTWIQQTALVYGLPLENVRD